MFSRLNAAAFEACFFDWVSAVNQATGGQVIAIDGKELCHSFDTLLGQKAIHLVNAWASENRLTAHRVRRDNASGNVQHSQQFRNGRDFIRLVIHFHLAQD